MVGGEVDEEGRESEGREVLGELFVYYTIF
jgi:hypothetical protein